MRSFQVRDGKVMVDGVIYSQNPSTDSMVMGKMGRIHSIMIEGKGQFFPIGGQFDDGSIKTVDSTTDVLDSETPTKKRSKKTELVESNGTPMDETGKPIVKKSKSKKK